MKALVKAAPESGAVELRSQPKPSIESEEALVAVEAAGLCGSDAGIYTFKPAYHGMELPVVIGHEYAGSVVEVGDRVEDVSVGDRVIEQPIRACGTCYQCRTGSPNVCRDARITGVHHDGAYAEYVAVPAEGLHPIPDELSFAAAAIAEPTSVAARAVAQNSRVSPGDRVLVEGPGPVGLLTAQIACERGGKVVVSGVSRDRSYRLPLAEELGFTTAAVDKNPIEDVIADATDGVGFDVVFDTTGHPSGVNAAAESVRKGGQVVLIGLAGETELDFTPLIRAEVDLQCSYASTWEDFERAIRLIRRGAIDTDTFVDTRFTLENSEEAFETFLTGDTCKPVFDVSTLRD